MIVGKIKQTDKIIEIDTNMIGYQWSENLQLQVAYDETYKDWSKKWDAIGSNKKERIPLIYDDTSKTILLSKECFADEILYIACAFVKDDVIVNSNPLQLFIANSVNHGLDKVPEDPSLYEEMQKLFEQIWENEYRPITDKIETDTRAKLKALVDDTESKVNVLKEEATSQQVTAKRQQTDAETQQTNALENQKDVQDLINDVESRIQKGEFNGTNTVVPANGWYTFDVIDGYLYLGYPDNTEPPSATIDEDGILELDLKEVAEYA